jgi:hypothetical protein
LGEDLLSVAFEFEEHGAVAEARVAAHDTSADVDWGAIEPKGGVPRTSVIMSCTQQRP